MLSSILGAVPSVSSILGSARTAAQAALTGRGVHTPFVTLYLQPKSGAPVEIPLLDAQRASQMATVPNGQGPVQEMTNVQPLYLINFTHTKKVTMSGGNRISLTILDPTWDYIESLILDSAPTYMPFSVKYGWRGVDDLNPATIPLNYSLDTVSMEILPFRGAQIVLGGIDNTWKLWLRPISKAFSSTITIAAVILEMVTDPACGLNDVIQGVSIPDSSGLQVPIGEEHCRMECQTPGAYLNHLLSLAAPGAAGSCYTYDIGPSEDRSKTLLHIRSLAQPIAKRTYYYGRDRNSEMLSFRPRMDKAALLTLGSARMGGITVDPMTQTMIRFSTTQEEDVAIGPKTPNKTPTTDSQKILSPFSAASTLNLTRTYRASIDQFGYHGEATIEGDTGLNPFDMINIVVLKSDPTQPVTNFTTQSIHKFSSGVWRIWEVEHTIAEGGFHTRLVLFRNSGFIGEGESGIPQVVNFAPPELTPEGQIAVKVEPLSNPDALAQLGL